MSINTLICIHALLLCLQVWQRTDHILPVAVLHFGLHRQPVLARRGLLPQKMSPSSTPPRDLSTACHAEPLGRNLVRLELVPRGSDGLHDELPACRLHLGSGERHGSGGGLERQALEGGHERHSAGPGHSARLQHHRHGFRTPQKRCNQSVSPGACTKLSPNSCKLPDLYAPD
ncbi:hypothetical protein KC19_11G043100, partial [Ceratodon purpureus]